MISPKIQTCASIISIGRLLNKITYILWLDIGTVYELDICSNLQVK